MIAAAALITVASEVPVEGFNASDRVAVAPTSSAIQPTSDIVAPTYNADI
jgi:hypothetical protein